MPERFLSWVFALVILIILVVVLFEVLEKV